jgi:acyl carrier protein
VDIDCDKEIRRILSLYGQLAVDIATLSDHDDLYFSGLNSQANVNVLLALEAAFDIEFPEEALRRSTFESVAAIRGAISRIEAEAVTA